MFTYQLHEFADLVKAQPKPEEPVEAEESEPGNDAEETDLEDEEDESEADVEPVSLKTEGSSGAMT